MRWILGLGAIVLFVNSGSFGQIKQGSWELSLSGNFGSTSGSTENTPSQGISFKSDIPAQGYLSIAFRPGYYVVEGFSIEPEILWTSTDATPPSFSFTGNLAYHFVIPQSRMIPFVLAGYGKANGIPMFQILDRLTEGFDVSVFNIGGGMKLFVVPRIAFRAEYRFQRFGYETDTEKTTRVFHNFFVGFSFFLP